MHMYGYSYRVCQLAYEEDLPPFFFQRDNYPFTVEFVKRISIEHDFHPRIAYVHVICMCDCGAEVPFQGICHLKLITYVNTSASHSQQEKKTKQIKT